MINGMFQRRFRREMPLWIDRGWLTRDAGEAILAELAERSATARTPAWVLGGLGAVLLAMGVFLFFAANWQGLPKLTKLGLACLMVWASYAAAIGAARKGAERFAEALVLLGCLLFGAAIMLIGQAYHLAADPPGGVLLWLLGTLVAAWLWPSVWCTYLAVVLDVVWFTLAHEWDHVGSIPWFHLLPWVAILVLAIKQESRLAQHGVALALVWWSFASMTTLIGLVGGSDGDGVRLAVALSAAVVTVTALIGHFNRPHSAVATLFQYYGLVPGVVCLLLLAIPELYGSSDVTTLSNTTQVGAWNLWGAAVLLTVAAAAGGTFLIWRDRGIRLPVTLALLAAPVIAVVAFPVSAHLWGLTAIECIMIPGWLAIVGCGYRMNDRVVIIWGLLAFFVSLLEIYFTTLWSFLDRSWFFIGGGMLVIGLGWVLEHRRRGMFGVLERRVR